MQHACQSKTITQAEKVTLRSLKVVAVFKNEVRMHLVFPARFEHASICIADFLSGRFIKMNRSRA
jgi:hypothetical protein